MKNLKSKMKISLLTKGINKIFSRKKSNYKEVIDDLIDKQDIVNTALKDVELLHQILRYLLLQVGQLLNSFPTFFQN